MALSTKGQLETPTFRQKSASPWRVTRFYPHLPSNPLLLGLSTLALEAPDLPYQASLSDTQLPEKVIRLTLSFSLLNNGIPRGPNEDELPELEKHFPTLRTVSYQYPFLLLGVEHLPEQPWPTFVADLPLWLTVASDFGPFRISKVARHSQTFNVKGDIQLYETPNEATVLEIFQLLNRQGADVDRIQWDGIVIRAFGSQEPEQGWKNYLLSRINDIAVAYHWTDQTMEEHTLRPKTLSTAKVADNTEYGREHLRPGIMISGRGSNMQEGSRTTSGVCVESPQGKKFITVAAHSFPVGVGCAVYHPQSPSNGEPDARYQIGTIDRMFEETDIALAELQPGIRYARETFAQPTGQPFRNFKTPETLRIYDPVFMNTPVTGHCEGVHLGTEWSLCFEATDEDPQPKQALCNVINFSYWGYGSDTLFDGCAGCVIWDQNFDVLGQFGFQEKDGSQRVCAPSLKILEDQGYKLSTI